MLFQVSQTEPPEITTPTMDITRNISDVRTDDERDESRTQTVTQTATTFLSATTKHNMMTGGVSVEVDEHLDKNREISVTPQPSQMSQTSMLTSLTNMPHHIGSMVSVTGTKTPFVPSHNKKHKSNRPITPFGSSRQRFGSTTATSVQSVGGIQHAIRSASPSDTLASILKSQGDVDEDKEDMKPLELAATANASNTPSMSPSPTIPEDNDDDGHLDVMDEGDIQFKPRRSTNLKLIEMGDLPMNLEEARRKTRITAHNLFMKYVNSGGEYEINIPSRMRRKLTQRKIHILEEWIDEVKADIPELYTLFDECMEEMFALMRSSISIFLESEDYQKIVVK